MRSKEVLGSPGFVSLLQPGASVSTSGPAPTCFVKETDAASGVQEGVFAQYFSAF